MKSHKAAFGIGGGRVEMEGHAESSSLLSAVSPSPVLLEQQDFGGWAGRGPHQTRPQARDSPHASRPASVLACPGQSINIC